MPRGGHRPQCSVVNCDKPNYGHGFCQNHYNKLARPPCSIEGCGKSVSRRNWCSMHLKRWLVHGNPLTRKTEINIGKLCSKECGAPAKVKGRCLRHFHQAKKQEIIDAYGNRCVCCGEDAFEFLSIDHINGDGAAHRQKVAVYDDLKKRGFPQDEYQLLCMNCNFSKGQYGYCPHQKGI